MGIYSLFIGCLVSETQIALSRCLNTRLYVSVGLLLFYLKCLITNLLVPISSEDLFFIGHIFSQFKHQELIQLLNILFDFIGSVS